MGFVLRRKLYQQVWLDLVRIQVSPWLRTSNLSRLITIDHLHQYVSCTIRNVVYRGVLFRNRTSLGATASYVCTYHYDVSLT